MSRKQVCIKIPKLQGEKAITLANSLEVVDRGLKVQRDEKFIYIPLIRPPQEDTLQSFNEQLSNFAVSTYVFPERKKQPTTLREILESELPSHLLSNLPQAIDFVGNIAIVRIPPELSRYKSVIGEAILELHKNAKTVLAKAGAVRGTYRLREFDVIAGEPNTETIHREYGCQYHVDLAKAYFSPRLSYEHNRVASQVQEGETIVDLFTGVGPFAVMIAKTHEDVEVYAIDVNPHAVESLKKNIILNKVEGKIHPMLGSAEKIVDQKLSGVADRVIMNLPEKAIQFVAASCEALKPTGGIVHFYSFVNTSNTFDELKTNFTIKVEKQGRTVEKILFSRMVRATAPYQWQVVLDVEIR